MAAGIAVGAAGFLVVADDAAAGPKAAKKKGAAVVSRAEVPLGLQGLRGAGGNVVIPFTLVDARRILSDVRVEYGWDVDGDGSIYDGSDPDDKRPIEYFPATEDRLDKRDTRKNKNPQLFVTAGDIGATHAFVWRSPADIQTGRLETLLYKYTPQGRKIPDPNSPPRPDPANPGEFLPGEYLFDDAQAGVRIRIRAERGKGAKRVIGEWAYTDPFSLNNNSAPSMSIDQVLPNSSGTASDENVEILWTGIDADSEDANNNGAPDDEDVNGNGVVDQEQLGVAFDYYRLEAGQDPATMTDEDLAKLPWLPCSRAAGQGNTDEYNATNDDNGARVYGTPGGRQWKFVWDSIRDVGTVRDRFVLRAQPVDAKKENGPFVYLRTPFNLDNYKVFTSGAAKGADITLAAGRTGCTVTNLVYGLERSDAKLGEPFQQVVVAGGSLTQAGAGVSNVDLFFANVITADTTSADPKQFVSFDTPRRFHTATLLSDGRVLFAGGFDQNGQPTNTTEIYDPATRTMHAGPALASPRARHTAVLLSTNDVAIIGGVGAGNAVLDTVEIYHFQPVADELAGTPTNVPTTLLATRLSVPQHSAKAVLLPDQTVLITAGITGNPDDAGAAVQSADLLDPLAGAVDAGVPGGVKTKNPTVSAIPGTMVLARKFAGATALLDGNVLFSGGVGGGVVHPTMEVYDWHARTFRPVSVTMPDGGRCSHVASLLGDGSVLLAGGATSDPSGGAAAVTGSADVFRLGAFDGTAWTGTFLPVNGDMRVARRGANAAVMMSGRPFIAGGVDAGGNPVALAEVFTPENSRNFAPKAYVSLPSSTLSHAYGATINYRLVDIPDPEVGPVADGSGDRARVIVQFRAPSLPTWQACSSQPDTIGGDEAETTENLTTTTQDVQPTDLAIDPVGRNTPGDHLFIWSMVKDIDRPLKGEQVGPYNVRVIPYGAVRGVQAASSQLTVLYNTKPVTTILPLADVAGNVNPFQGGDIDVAVHVRDIDDPIGTGDPVAGYNGDPCSVAFEYAVDANGDGQITSAANEYFFPMTAAGLATGTNLPHDVNPLQNVQSWSLAPDDPNSDPVNRPADKGWTHFTWDALYDLGPPTSATNWEVRNIWIRVTAGDPDAGFPKILRNKAGQPDEFVYVRDELGLWLESFDAAGGNNGAVKVNEPLVFTFNGHVDPASVNEQTIRIYRDETQVLGFYVTRDDQPVAGKSTVTFYPQLQELDQGKNVYNIGDEQTVLFPLNEYRYQIAGYTAGQDPDTNAAGTIRPLSEAVLDGVRSTYEIVNSAPVDGDLSSLFRFTTATGHYNDGLPVMNTAQTPSFGDTLAQSGQGFVFDFDHAIDAATVRSPNVTVTGNTTNYVVPGVWTVVNTTDPSNGKTSSQLTFQPLFKFPSGDQIKVNLTSGFLGSNGQTVTGYSTTPVYATDVGAGRQTLTYAEDFSTLAMKDTSYTTASWGDDLCAPGSLTGLQDFSTPPQGGSALTVKSGTTTQITATTADYSDIVVEKGGTLQLRASGPVLLRATGNITIDGKVDVAGIEGDSGHHGYNAYYYGPTYAYSSSVVTPSSTAAVRKGGASYNGGGKGGDSQLDKADSKNGDSGSDGSGTSSTGGQGGQKPYTSSSGGSTSAFYYYGAGGGAGGGHARDGFDGGYSGAYTTSPVGAVSTRGYATTVASDFTSGITAGGGGGGGGAVTYVTSSGGVGYFHMGGAGGSGAGAVTFNCNGTFTLGPTGYINGQGGQGGAKSHYAGAGGAGAGGSVWVKAGLKAVIDGVIDLRGGRGGPPGYAYYADTYMYYNSSSYGTRRYGGDGSPGRVVIEAPNYQAGKVDNVRVFGQMIVRQVSSIPTTTLSQSTIPSAFQNTASTGLFIQDMNPSNGTAVTDVRYASLDIPANRIVKLRNGTGTRNSSLRIYVDGNVNISGKLELNGSGMAPHNYSYFVTTTGAFDTNYTEYQPFSSYYTPIYLTQGYTYAYSSSAYANGFSGVAGGGDGGGAMGATSNSGYEGKDGTGKAPGKHVHKANGGWVYSSSYAWNWYVGDNGGGGAGNATPGREGWSAYAAPYGYNYTGGVVDSTLNGVSANTRLTKDASPAGAALDTAGSNLSVSNIGNVGGSGGGGGNAGGWGYYGYFGAAGLGGGGGGSLAIICQNNITINSKAELNARGGDGNTPGFAYPYYYSHSAGGGGSGGTIYLVGNNVTIAKVNTGEGTTFDGATFDLRGGYGGGWRHPYRSTAILHRQPYYNSHGNFGGDGGFGRLVVEYKNSLNGGNVLANKWGFEQATFIDGTQQYRALAGQATYKCRGKPGGDLFRSNFLDLGSLRPKVNSLTVVAGPNTTYTLIGEGAQSHPHNLGLAGIGEPDLSNTKTVNPGTNLGFDGYRFWRWSGSIARFDTKVQTAPTLSQLNTVYETDK